MNHFRYILKKINVLCLFFIGGIAWAQTPIVYIDGTTLIVDGTTMDVVGLPTINGIENAESTKKSEFIITGGGKVTASDLFNSDSVLVKDGTLHLTTGYKADFSAYIENNDSIIVNVAWKNNPGLHYSPPGSGAVLRFDLTDTGLFSDDTLSTFDQVDFAGTGFKHVIDGTVKAYSLKFENGIVEVTDNDTLIKFTGDIINVVNPNSYVSGKLYQYDGGTFEFPVGKPTIGNRPAGIVGLASPAWVVMEAFPNDPIMNPLDEGNGVDALYDYNFWEVKVGDTYTGASIALSSITSDTIGFGGNAANPVVTHSNSLAAPFNSLGGATYAIGNPYFSVNSTTNGAGGFYLLGNECLALQLNVLALLEGGYDIGTATYQADPEFVNLLDLRYNGTATGTAFTDYKTMDIGYLPSDDASNEPIDVVKVFFLEPTSPFNKVDSVLAWVKEDGMLWDFETGTENFLSFCGSNIVNGNEYRLGIKARNHLNVIYEPSFKADKSSVTTFDFTDLVNIYGAVATKTIGTRDYIVAGEVTDDNAINAKDYFGVMNQVFSLPINVYQGEDINFDSDVEVGDRDLILYNSVRLFYSTFPE